MESDWVSKRAHLRALLRQHPDWSVSQFADAVGFARSTVSRWKRRLLAANPTSISILFSRSRAPHRHPPRVAQAVVDRIIELRLSPPEQLRRTPGPKALLYYLPRDETLRQLGVHLPTSTRTIWRILDQAGLIERTTPSQRSPRDSQGLLEEVQVDVKDVGTATVDPTAPTTKRHHLIEVCNAGRCWLLAAALGPGP